MQFTPGLSVLSPSFAIIMTGWLALAVTMTSIPTRSQAAVLVENAAPKAVIVLANDPTDREQQAAAELADYIQKISGAQLAITSPGKHAAGKLPIYIGAAADATLLDTIREQGRAPSSFILDVAIDSVSLVGLSGDGTLFATYELLEQLGVRWFMPGELGTVIPRRATLKLAEQRNVQVPSFTARHMNDGLRDNPAWGLHMRMGGPNFPAAHGIPPFKGRKTVLEFFNRNPEYFAMIDGERVPRQLCVSNPEVAELAIGAAKDYFRRYPDRRWIGMGPNDGPAFCECADCEALDAGNIDPFTGERVVTDRYITFFNRVLAGIEDEYPDKRIAFYIYHNYQEPPIHVTPDPRIVGALAPIALCRIHGPNNPVCPEKSYYLKLAAAWSDTLDEVYDRGYWFNLAEPGLPFMMMHRLRNQVPMAHAAGLTGWRVETLGRWASETPSLYVAAKLMWNHQADVDLLLSDFHEKFYGPAAKPMAAYTALLDRALRDADHHTGGAADMPHIYPLSLRQQARAHLDHAAALVDDGPFVRRVGLAAGGFEYLTHFIAMLEQRNRHDFAAAQQSLDAMRAVQQDLISNYDIPMLHPRAAESYTTRFWSQATEQGHARLSDGGELVAPLSDRWDFHLDHSALGEALGWQAAGEIGGNWRPILTASSSWSNQGLRYHKGLGWYRQAVDIPEKYQGQRVFLWFGGVDEKAKVWVNGQLVGISPGAAFLPFEVDVTDVVRPGATNTVAVLVSNSRLDELGTGGITAPAMFYAPAAGDDAVVENVRDMGRTFP